MEIPESLSAARVGRGERAAVIAEEDQASVSRKQPAPAAALEIVRNVRDLPCDLAGLNVDRADVALGGLAGDAASPAAVEGFARLPPRRRLGENRAGFSGHHVKQSCCTIVRRGHPVRGPGYVWAGFRTLNGGLGAGQDLGAAVRTDAARPGELVDEWLAQ